MYHYTDCGLPNIYLRGGGFEVIETEYGEAVSIHNVEGLHKAIGMDLISQSPCLSNNAVRFLRKEMKLTQSDLSNILGVTEDTVRNWESGRVPIAPPADRLIRTIYREQIGGDGKVRDILENIARLTREIREADRTEDRNFEECDQGWCIAA